MDPLVETVNLGPTGRRSLSILVDTYAHLSLSGPQLRVEEVPGRRTRVLVKVYSYSGYRWSFEQCLQFVLYFCETFSASRYVNCCMWIYREGHTVCAKIHEIERME